MLAHLDTAAPGYRRSNEPVSHAIPPSLLPSCGLGTPRWSLAGGGQVPWVTESMVGLPATKAWVRVGPPLLASVVLRMFASAVDRLPFEVTVMSVAPGVKSSKAWALVSP
jgi:hypothetical protein